MATPSLSSVQTAQPVGYAGGLVDMGEPHDIISASNENATALDFGQVCVRGTAVAAGAVKNVKPQTADGDAIEGVTMAAPAGLIADSSNTINYARYATLPVLKKGRIYVVPCENVVAGTNALVITAGTGSKIASTTGGAAGAGRIAFPGGAVWETTTSSGALGILNLNLP
jgi:hypothetical protein